MEFEAPADAWYVWLGVAATSVAAASVALALPSTPPPDANAAANAIDRAAGSSLDATATYEHDADEVRLGPRRIAMRNDGGTARASVAFGTVTPVAGNDDLEAVLRGAAVDDVYDGARAPRVAFRDDVESAQAAAAADADWRPSEGILTARSVTYRYPGGEQRVTLVAA